MATINLYKMSCERNVVDKTNYLTPPTLFQLTGTFRESVNIMNPSILIEYSGSPDFNYVKIEDIGRFYFVDSYAFERNGLLRLNLSLDVLHTYRTTIKSQTAIVGRYQVNENPGLPDNQRPMKNSTTNSALFWGSSNPFDVTRTYASPYEPFNCVLIVANELNSIYTDTTTPSVETGLSVPNPQIMPAEYSVYLMTTDDLEQVLIHAATATTGLFGGAAQYEFIVGAWAYPFDMHVTGDTLTRVKLGDQELVWSGILVKDKTRLFKVFDFGNFTSALASTSYLNYEPYTRGQVFLPYIGFKDISMRELLRSGGLTLKYVVDIMSGECEAVIYSTNIPGYKIMAETGTIGTSVPISNSNVVAQRNNIVNFITSTAISAAMLATPQTAGAGLAGLTKSGIGIINNDLIIHGKMPPSSVTRYVPQRPQIYYQKQDYIIPANYGSLVGFPSMMSHTLSDLTGFAVIDTIHLTGFTTATLAEVNEIDRLLKSGVIF